MTVEMARIRLLVWNYNYSSWSMRAGLALRGTGAPFDEESVNDAAGPRPEVARLSPSGRFPLLLHGKVLVWDSLAIGEYLADLFPRAGLLPRDVVERARIRSICSEIHSGLANLRQELPMNIRRSGVQCTISDAAGTEVERAFDLVRERQRLWAGAPSSIFAEGFSLGDAFLAPLVMRFRSYGVSMPEDIQAYAGALLVHPAVKDWIARALGDVFVDRQYEFV
jgi:glutathione S-transferase